MNTSFYGGRWGKSFEIAKIFMNKLALINDLNDPNSSIHCGELVFISYGNDYDSNLEIDGGKSYNNTLWKKDYLLKDDELINIEIIENNSNPKLVYRQLANITGTPAKFKVGTVETLPAGENATVIIDSSNIYNPIISFGIPKGDQGIQGDRGPQGYYFIPSISENGDLSWSNTGDLENPQVINIKGPKGDDGTSFIIKGMYPTFEDLQLAHPIGNPGDAYAIGTDTDNIIYIWSVETNEWISIGKIQGPKGDTGADGGPGPTGPIGPQGEDGGYYSPSVDSEGNLTWTASESDMPSVVGANIRGPIGPTGIQGPVGADGKSAYQAAAEGGFVGDEQLFNTKLADLVDAEYVANYVDTAIGKALEASY